MTGPVIRSLVWATDIDVLALDKRVERRDGYWRIESPSNHTFWWGNFLLFDEAPEAGDLERWTALFDAEFKDTPEIRHRVFAWDQTDAEPGEIGQFIEQGYETETVSGLTATPDRLTAHPKANPAVEVRPLSPVEGEDAELWDGVLEIQLAELATSQPRDAYAREFREGRNRGLRELFRAGRGSWYVAIQDGQVVGSLGIVVTDGRARFQSVDTAVSHRRQGVARRLVHEAARHAGAQQPIDHYVMVADPDYHAIGIYESLGFARAETVVGVCLKPSGR